MAYWFSWNMLAMRVEGTRMNFKIMEAFDPRGPQDAGKGQQEWLFHHKARWLRLFDFFGFSWGAG